MTTPEQERQYLDGEAEAERREVWDQMAQDLYNERLQACFLIARDLILAHDILADLHRRMTRAEDFGCFMDPTAWRQGIDVLQEQRKMIDVLWTASAECLKLRSSLVEAEGKMRARRLPLGQALGI